MGADGPGASPAPGASSAPGSSSIPPPDTARVREVAQEFEAMILSQMLASMRRVPGAGKPTLGGRGQDLYRQMMDDELGKVLARGGGLGLTDTLVRDLIRQTAAPKKASSPTGDPPIDRANGGGKPGRLERGLP